MEAESTELSDMLRKSREVVSRMSETEKQEMLEAQRLAWARSCQPCEHGNDWEECPECWEVVYPVGADKG